MGDLTEEEEKHWRLLLRARRTGQHPARRGVVCQGSSGVGLVAVPLSPGQQRGPVLTAGHETTSRKPAGAPALHF